MIFSSRATNHLTHQVSITNFLPNIIYFWIIKIWVYFQAYKNLYSPQEVGINDKSLNNWVFVTLRTNFLSIWTADWHKVLCYVIWPSWVPMYLFVLIVKDIFKFQSQKTDKDLYHSLIVNKSNIEWGILGR